MQAGHRQADQEAGKLREKHTDNQTGGKGPEIGTGEKVGGAVRIRPMHPGQNQQYVLKPKYYHTHSTHTQSHVQSQPERPIPLTVGHNPIHGAFKSLNILNFKHINVTLDQGNQSDQARGPLQPIGSSKRPKAANRIKREAQGSQSDQARGSRQPIGSSKRPKAANRIKQEAGFPSCFPNKTFISAIFNYEELYKSKHYSN
ncbi:hypothetical protein EYF80_031463 [Liparis tanakae]|uniref:Uncharacterized protein n=1 Tax=Liparis tanakae TaxID=230148 RepID=A0A4Z2GYH0_9TELE|nr:hypothetical protein EYF80_031463 [Liparis tanakae]